MRNPRSVVIVFTA